MACSAALVACSPRPDEVRIGRILIDAPQDLDRASVEREQLRELIRADLADADFVELTEGRKDATHMLQVRIGAALPLEAPVEGAGAESAGPAELVRSLEVQLRPTGQAAGYEAVARCPAGADLAASAHAGFRDAWRVLDSVRRLDVQKDEALIAALADAEPRVRDFAIQRLGDRKSKAGVPALCNLLTAEERPELVLRVIGSLVSIGDERAVTPLIDLTYKKDPAFVLQVVFAVAAIGGRSAEAFLVTVASGHPHEAVQKGAEDALAELGRRRKQP